MHRDLSKSQIIEKFDLIQCKFDEFEATKKTDELLVSAIVSIGKGLAPETNDSDKEWAETTLKLSKPVQKCVDRT